MWIKIIHFVNVEFNSEKEVLCKYYIKKKKKNLHAFNNSQTDVGRGRGEERISLPGIQQLCQALFLSFEKQFDVLVFRAAVCVLSTVWLVSQVLPVDAHEGLVGLLCVADLLGDAVLAPQLLDLAVSLVAEMEGVSTPEPLISLSIVI